MKTTCNYFLMHSTKTVLSQNNVLTQSLLLLVSYIFIYIQHCMIPFYSCYLHCQWLTYILWHVEYEVVVLVSYLIDQCMCGCCYSHHRNILLSWNDVLCFDMKRLRHQMFLDKHRSLLVTSLQLLLLFVVCGKSEFMYYYLLSIS